jgi:hypothetical protein
LTWRNVRFASNAFGYQPLVKRVRSRHIGALGALLLIITACSEAAGDNTTAPPTTSTTTVATTTTTIPAPNPDVQAGIDWFVSILNGEELTEAEYDSRFTEEFRQQVPYEEGFQPVLDQFRPLVPYTVAERIGEGTQGEAIIESAEGTKLRVQAELDDDGVFSTLLIQPAEEPSLDDPPATVEEGFQRLATMGVFRGVAAEVVDGECVPVEASAADEPAPIGSVFKLYVLTALGDAVQSGDVAWDDEIVIRDELKSAPSGVLQDRPDGETVTVLEAAELMISISDNTATDHLIDLLGRETVETALSTYGNTTPGLNTPLLGTRELMALKVGPASGLAVQWLEGDEEARRGILAQISGITPSDLPLQEWVEPIDPDRLEWFASPNDLCTLALDLLDLASSVPEIGEILAVNPGIPADPSTWDSIWFKGGSEPGLLAAWWVTTSEGRTFVATGSVVNPDSVIDTDQATLLFAAVRDLLSP